MNQLDLAIHSTVHDFKGGTQNLADAMGMSRQILLNKACPTTENAYFAPAQLIQLQNITGNYAINDALNAMQQNSQRPEKDLTHAMMSVSRDFAVVIGDITESMEDYVMSERERRQCLNSVTQMIDECEDLKHAISREGLANKIKAV